MNDDDLSEEESDYVDEIMEQLSEVSGDGEGDDFIGELVEVGAIEEVGAKRLYGMRGSARAKAVRRLMIKKFLSARRRTPGGGLPSPPFGRSQRSTERRAPLGFIEDVSGESFFTLPGVLNSTTIMRGKVSRDAHTDRLLIVPSDPGAVLESIKVGDEEQLLSSGAPVELYSTAALTDAVPDNFSPLSSALDLVITLKNTTVGIITGTIGVKANVKR